MISSMTGFGRGTALAGGKKICVDIKSLNSKQLDLIIKFPGRYKQLEGELRNALAFLADRGKIEVTCSVEQTGQDSPMLFNIELLAAYKKQIEELDSRLGIETPSDWHSVLLRLPDVNRGEDDTVSEAEEDALRKAFAEAADKMTLYRAEEGKRLHEFLEEKIACIRTLLQEIEPHEAGRVAKIKSRLEDQLDKLTGVEVDRGRLEQELIYYIEKLDISEEKQRLATHLDYFLSTMNGDEEGGGLPKGKKLGFIAQEMGREINTMGSKSNNAEMQIIVVKMKDELEQIKEQVLNVL